MNLITFKKSSGRSHSLNTLCRRAGSVETLVDAGCKHREPHPVFRDGLLAVVEALEHPRQFLHVGDVEVDMKSVILGISPCEIFDGLEGSGLETFAKAFVDFLWTQDIGQEGMNPGKAWPAVFLVEEPQVGKQAVFGAGVGLNSQNSSPYERACQI